MEGNQVFQNDSTGIAGTTLVTVRGNTGLQQQLRRHLRRRRRGQSIRSRREPGLPQRLGTTAAAASGPVWRQRQAQRGLFQPEATASVVEGYEGNFRVIANNLCYNNGDAADEYNIMLPANYWQAKQGLVENNTVYGGERHLHRQPHQCHQPQQHHLGHRRRAATPSCATPTWIAGIVERHLVSDNNCILATGGAIFSAWLGNQNDLLEWRKATGQDTHSFSADPLFVNAAGADGVLGGTNGLDDNFHLASTAGSYKGLALHRADHRRLHRRRLAQSSALTPACRRAPSGAEQAPNGGRIDLGAFGGTADASLSTGARAVELGLIGGGSVLARHGADLLVDARPVAIATTPCLLEYSSNGGGSWSTIPGAAALPFADGVFAWDTSALTPGSNYKVRATPNARRHFLGVRPPARVAQHRHRRSTSTTAAPPTTCIAPPSAATPTTASRPPRRWRTVKRLVVDLQAHARRHRAH